MRGEGLVWIPITKTKCRHGTPVNEQCADCALADDSQAITEGDADV